MQWWIDIFKEWVIAQGYAKTSWVIDQDYLTQSYVFRGDPAAIDFAAGDFTKNNAWHDLDLSGIVPAGAQAVDVRCSIRSTAIGKQIEFRRNGQVNVVCKAITWTQVANNRMGFPITIPIDSNRIIEYRVQDDTFNQINFVVKGWWF